EAVIPQDANRISEPEEGTPPAPPAGTPADPRAAAAAEADALIRSRLGNVFGAAPAPDRSPPAASEPPLNLKGDDWRAVPPPPTWLEEHELLPKDGSAGGASGQ
ncbi:MAG: hypothetical protein KJZ96_05240, partial [Rhodocyclaceae bacterium]|nr:hypothetical protein [Rhodocyclaceae bacterium]